ncbi:AMP-binding protein [Bacteriovorax sp. DB6_IX]|uniref:AMP-binding protein n=1 Tax=Bacteriovorax sp. DB6_IX TaxID=1353530 RepID=UPI00038A3CB9|nr:AMP-binding protein [Bacteriovorax sp. DB6_IX]EQC51733.1 AMP-binding enzyme [Bacteriovorax sp. DB6_IX]
MKIANLAQRFIDNVRKHPDKLAFVIPKGIDSLETYHEINLTYQDFYNEVSKYRNGLIESGYQRGDRIIILAPISEKTYAFMLAVFSLGMVCVFLDPGIGLKKILNAISDSGAKAIVSIDKLLKYHYFIPQLWFKKKYSADRTRLGVRSFDDLYSSKVCEIEALELEENDHALITFTSGSTGRSKGSDRNIKNVTEQIKSIEKNWNCHEDIIDFPSFPMFGFMNLLCGITTVVPAVDFAKIADYNPDVVIHQMTKWKVNRMCGSFAFNKKLVDNLKQREIQISTLTNLAFGGCPVTKEFCADLDKVYPNAKCEIIYGSTEVAPISTAEVNEMLNSKGQGFLVGRPYDGVEVAIVKLPKIISEFDKNEAKPYSVETGDVGEVIIKGAHVVQTYVDNPKATKENKILSPDGQRWHRTGDCGRIDDQGRLWLVGRVKDIIQFEGNEFHPYPIEESLDELEAISRSALIQDKAEIKVFIETKIFDNIDHVKKVITEKVSSFGIREFNIIQIDKIPVDDRHNSKINRVKLRETHA